MWRVTIKGLLAKKLRLVLTSIAVVLGVAFMSGTFVLTDTIGRVFDDLFSQQANDIDAVVRAKQEIKSDGPGPDAPRNPVSDSLLPTVEDATGVKAANGSVFGRLSNVIGSDGDVVDSGGPTFGFNWPAKEFASLYRLQSGSEPTSPDEVALDKRTADKGSFKVGDEVTILSVTAAPRTFTVSGIFKYGETGSLAGATLAGFETDTAQEVMNRVGEFDNIDVQAASGTTPPELVRNVRVALRDAGEAKGLEVKTGQAVADETADDIKQGLSFFNTFLLVFAFISLFVGAFIIYNTFSIIVAQRSRELALLRAIGASTKQVKRSVSLEALVVGLLSSVLGLLVGILVAIGLQGAALGLRLLAAVDARR